MAGKPRVAPQKLAHWTRCRSGKRSEAHYSAIFLYNYVTHVTHVIPCKPCNHLSRVAHGFVTGFDTGWRSKNPVFTGLVTGVTGPGGRYWGKYTPSPPRLSLWRRNSPLA